MSTGYARVEYVWLRRCFVFCLLVAHKFCGNCVAAGEIMAKALLQLGWGCAAGG